MDLKKAGVIRSDWGFVIHCFVSLFVLGTIFFFYGWRKKVHLHSARLFSFARCVGCCEREITQALGRWIWTTWCASSRPSWPGNGNFRIIIISNECVFKWMRFQIHHSSPALITTHSLIPRRFPSLSDRAQPRIHCFLLSSGFSMQFCYVPVVYISEVE